MKYLSIFPALLFFLAVIWGPNLAPGASVPPRAPLQANPSLENIGPATTPSPPPPTDTPPGTTTEALSPAPTPSPAETPAIEPSPSPAVSPSPSPSSAPSVSPAPSPSLTPLASPSPSPVAFLPVSPSPSPAPVQPPWGILKDRPPWIILVGVGSAAVLLLLLLGVPGMILLRRRRRPPRPTRPMWVKPSPPFLEAYPAGRRWRFEIRKDSITIGRAPGNDLVIPTDFPGWDTVSRQHARIYRRDGLWIVEDLGSTNGVYVNGRRTGHNLLRDRWRLTIGGVEFIFRTGTGEVSP